MHTNLYQVYSKVFLGNYFHIKCQGPFGLYSHLSLSYLTSSHFCLGLLTISCLSIKNSIEGIKGFRCTPICLRGAHVPTENFKKYIQFAGLIPALSQRGKIGLPLGKIYHLYITGAPQPLRPDSSGKGIGRICGRFQVQVPIGAKTYLSKKKKKLVPHNPSLWWFHFLC